MMNFINVLPWVTQCQSQDIYSWNNNDVSFSYDGFAYGTQVSENQRDTDIIFPLGTGNYNIPTQNAALSDYYRSEPHIQSINFSSGKVLFVPTAHIRYDLPAADSYALDKIVIMNSNNQIVKQFKLKYVYWKTSLSANAGQVIPFDSLTLPNESQLTDYVSSNFEYRLLLTGIVEEDSLGNPLNNGYSFRYNTQVRFPYVDVADYRDAWGYFNNQVYNVTRDNTIPNPWYNRSGTSIPIYRFSNVLDASCLNPDESYITGGILDSVISPSGAVSSFYYENNQGKYASSSPYADIYAYWGAGIRVKAIDTRPYLNAPDSISELTLISYDSGACAAPLPISAIGFMNNDGEFYQYFSNTESSQDQQIGYAKVQVSHYNGGDNGNCTQQVIYRFNNPALYPDIIATNSSGYYDLAAPGNDVYDFLYGTLASQENYVSRSTMSSPYNPLSLKSKTEYQYNTSSYNGSCVGLILSPFIQTNSKYSGHMGSNKPRRITMTDYENGAPIESVVTDYTYTTTGISADPEEVSTEEVSLPNVVRRKTYCTYAYQYNQLPFSSGLEPYDQFYYYHRFASKPVEVISTTATNGGVEKVTNASLLLYNYYGNIDSIYKLKKILTPLPGFVSSLTNGNDIPYIDANSYKLSKAFMWNDPNLNNSYNNFNDPYLTQSIDYDTGDTTAYLYNLSSYSTAFINEKAASLTGYPWVAAHGVTFNNLKSLAHPANWTSPANFEADINQIRAALPNALISSAFYLPVVGKLEVTGPTKNSIHYEYDKASRPVLIRDKNNNIINKVEYHDKN